MYTVVKNISSHLLWDETIYRVIKNDCSGFSNLSHNTLEIGVYVFFYLIKQQGAEEYPT